MKKLLTLLALLVLYTKNFSQSVAINNDGTPPHPSAMLDVKSSTKGLLLPRTSTTTRNSIPGAKGLMVYDTTVNKIFYNIGSGWIEVSNGPNTNYWNTFGALGIYYLSGNVGIGMAPVYKLSVDGDALFTGDPPIIRFQGGSSSALPKMLWSYTDNYVDYVITHALDKLIFGRAGSFLAFTPDLVVDTGGYIGVGVLNPKARLHIDFGTDVGNASGGYLQLGSSSSGNIGIDNNEIQARNNGVVSRLVLQNGGGGVQVGSALVPAGYALSIDGKVICEELKVKLSSSGWPDYVFLPGHHQASLYELESFVKKYRHLPGIPSAQEVEKDGVLLGDMQKRLLEKVEELTLYIIELKKEIDQLKTTKQ